MDPDTATRSEERFLEHDHHGDTHEEVQSLYQIAVQERDDLREYVNRLEQQVLPQFNVNDSNLADIFVSQKNAYLERVIIHEKAAVEAERAHSDESQRLQRERVELQHRYDELHEQIFGQNGYKNRLQSTQIALELANNNRSPDIVECVKQLADMTKERDEFNREARRLGVRAEELHLNWDAALREVEVLRKQKVEWGNSRDDSIALQEANKEIERLRDSNIIAESYHVEASNRQVRRLQEEKIEWEEERTNLETRTAELSLRTRTLEDMLSASEAQQSSHDVQMPDVRGGNQTPLPLGDAVWRRWSNRLWDHIQVKPQQVEDIYNLASANLYRPGGAFPDSDLRVESPRQQFPGVTWVKQLIHLGSSRPVAPLVEEGTWRHWADTLQDLILTGSGEVEALYRLGDQRQLHAGVEWIRQLITIASDRPIAPDRPATLKEYQLGVEIKEAQIKIEELQDQVGSEVGLTFHNQVLRRQLDAANEKIEELKQEIEGITARFEDEIEQLERKLTESYHQEILFKSLYETGEVHRDKLDEIEQLKKDLRAAFDRRNRFKDLYEKQKILSDEHEEVWQQKFAKEVAGADKHAAGLVEEAETLQGRLNGAHGVIAELEKEVENLRKQMADEHTGDSGLGESLSKVAPEEARPITPDRHESEPESENENDESEAEEKSDSEELKTAKTDLFNTLEEVEELKLKLGFADRAFNDMKEEFEEKIAQIERNAKEDVTEKERMAEKLRQVEERFKRGVAAEVRRLEREGQRSLPVIHTGTQTDQVKGGVLVFPGRGKGKARKIPAALEAKNVVQKAEDYESPPITPLESPLESPDILMKDDKEYRGPRADRIARKEKAKDEAWEAGSEGVMGTRRSARATRNKKPIYRELPLKVLLERRKSVGMRKRKVEEVVGQEVEADGGKEGVQEGGREEIKRRGSKMV